MASEAIEDRPVNAPGTSRENGGTSPDPRLTTSDRSGTIEVAVLAERLDALERQHRLLRRDSLLLAGLTTIAAALAISVMLQKRFEPQPEMAPIASRRAISAQEFLLTDPQGHPRAKLTFE